MQSSSRFPTIGRPLLPALLALVLLAAPGLAQDWSVDVLDPATVDPATTGAVVPAEDLATADGAPQDLGLFPMNGAAGLPEGSLAQRYVFVRNGQVLAEYPPQVQGRIALVKLTDPTLPATPFALVANNAAAAGAVAVLFLSATTNPEGVTAPIPAANILPADGELLVDLIDETVDAEDPESGAISRFPIRLDPFFVAGGDPVAVPPTLTSGAYRGTRIAPGVTPDFGANPNTPEAFEGPALETVMFPVGREAAEPTLGVDRDGTAFYAAATFDAFAPVLPRTEVMRSHDGGATWENVSPPLPDPLQSEPPINGDPMVYVEPDSGRVFSLDTYDADCMWLIFTDDEGESWMRNPVVCDAVAVTDHQTIVAGPPTPELEPLVDLLFGKVLYTCFNTVASTNCLRSLDGGVTFHKVGFPYTGIEPDNDGPNPFDGVPGFCGGLTAHLQTDSVGRVFLPAGRCGLPRISVSEDGGVTWERFWVNRDIPLPGTNHETTTAIDAAGNLYMTWWDENDRLPYLAVSTDHGRTWSAALMIAPPGVEEVNFPTLDAGDEGRIVVHFPGTVVGDRSDAQRPWNLYQVVSTNALDEEPLFVFTIANDPAEPVHRGDCGPGRCAGMFDFLDVVVPPADAPAFAQGFWAAGVDTCNADCDVVGTAASGMDGVVVRQVAGPALRAEPLTIEDTDPAVEYRRGWHLRDDPGASGGTYHRRVGSPSGNGAGPTARLVFEGDGVTFFYATSDRGGAAEVRIDGQSVGTVSFAGATAAPAFGASTTWDGLGEGSHEIVVEHVSGIAYVDAFEIDPASGPAAADESAPLAISLTEVTTETLSGLPGAAVLATVLVDDATDEISVVVEGGANALQVLLLDPLGRLVASGGALLSGGSLSGVDLGPPTAGLHTIQVTDTTGGTGAVEISVARTVAWGQGM